MSQPSTIAREVHVSTLHGLVAWFEAYVTDHGDVFLIPDVHMLKNRLATLVEVGRRDNISESWLLMPSDYFHEECLEVIAAVEHGIFLGFGVAGEAVDECRNRIEDLILARDPAALPVSERT